MKRIIISIAAFFLLFLAWPNLIHEPLHLLALKMQGADGFITFGIHPSTTRVTPLNSIVGGFLFILLPSLFSIVVLALLWMTRKRAGLLTHIVLPIYLVIGELAGNILGYRNPTSDFHFLIALPHFTATVTAMVVMIGGGFIIAECWRCWHGRRGLRAFSTVGA